MFSSKVFQSQPRAAGPFSQHHQLLWRPTVVLVRNNCRRLLTGNGNKWNELEEQ